MLSSTTTWPGTRTRHEQREGRADRYGQPSPVVRTALLYGEDNPVDGAVLRVLLRKAEQIRRVLGVSVPVPVENTAVLNAIFEELFGKSGVSPPAVVALPGRGGRAGGRRLAGGRRA